MITIFTPTSNRTFIHGGKFEKLQIKILPHSFMFYGFFHLHNFENI